MTFLAVAEAVAVGGKTSATVAVAEAVAVGGKTSDAVAEAIKFKSLFEKCLSLANLAKLYQTFTFLMKTHEY